MAKITIDDEVRRTLRRVLVEEHDLLDSVRRQRPSPIPGEEGRYRCTCLVAMRRPLDPETAEMRRVEVSIRPEGEGWAIYAVEGLEGVEGIGE